MADIELTHQPLQSPGARLGGQETTGISTLEPGLKPPSSPSGKLIPIKVQMLDDTQEVHEVPLKASGKHLLELICHNLNLIESDYFALEFMDHHKVMVWLDLLKPIVKQVRRPRHVVMRFVVKFFPPDHSQLQEELTRYLFALQIKQDLASGRMTCNDTSAALLASHIIQSEIGDFDEAVFSEHLTKHKYIPQQEALEEKIKELHRGHVGQTPATSDYQLLEIARKLEMYGIRQHRAKDREGTKINLSVSHTGIIVFQGNNKINSFNWAKVRKLSFKRKRFFIKFRPEMNSCQDTLEFTMASRDSCKTFWKICVEYHAFFRLFEEPKPKPKPILFTRGSSFRFSGRTQKQLLDYVKEGGYKKTQFERKHSKMRSIRSLPDHQSLGLKQNDGFPFGKGLPSTGPPTPNERKDVVVTRPTEEKPVESKSHSPSRSPRKDGQEEARGQREQHNAGPAPRAAHSSCSSIPYIDGSDVDSEYEPVRARLLGSRAQTNDNDEDGLTSGGDSSEREEKAGYPSCWDSPEFRFASTPFHAREELVDQDLPCADLSFCPGRAYQAPRHRPLLRKAWRSPAGHSPIATPIGSGSAGSSPNARVNRATPKDFLTQNGHCWEDGRGSPVGRCSPSFGQAASGRVQGSRNRSETDPFILSRMVSTPLSARSNGGQDGLYSPRALHREGRFMGNRLPPARASPPVPRLLPAGLGAAQPAEGSTSSGTESSESDSEVIHSSSRPLVFGNPVAMDSSPLVRSGFSLGGLQLEEDLEEDSSVSFSDPDDASPVSEHGVITC